MIGESLLSLGLDLSCALGIGNPDLVRIHANAWVGVGLAIVLLWILADLRHEIRSHRQRTELQHEGRLEDVNAFYRRQLGSLRPWGRLFRRMFSPGAWEALYALHLYQIGRSEEALSWAETAVRKSRSHPRLLEQARNAKGLALLQLGRYDEARTVAGLLRSVRADSPAADSLEGWIDFYLGRLDEALSSLRRVPRGPKFDVARSLISSILHMKGEPKAALEVLLERPSDATTFYTPEALACVQGSEEGRSFLEAQQTAWAGVIQPGRFLHAAYIYLDLEDKEGLRFSLHKADSLMGGSPVLRRILRELEACLSALTGNAEGVDRSLREGRAILERYPKRASAMEFHRYAGRAQLLLGRPALAIPEFETSLEAALHPIEKHSCRYWLARALEAKGDVPRAKGFFREVVDDGIPSRLARDASTRLGG